MTERQSQSSWLASLGKGCKVKTLENLRGIGMCICSFDVLTHRVETEL